MAEPAHRTQQREDASARATGDTALTTDSKALTIFFACDQRRHAWKHEAPCNLLARLKGGRLLLRCKCECHR